MKMCTLHEEKATTLAGVNRYIYRTVLKHILKGNSRIKKPLKDNVITLQDIIQCIKTNRCLDIGKCDIGSTHMELTIGGTIRDTIPTKWINYARKIFGLHPLSQHELMRPKKGEAQGATT